MDWATGSWQECYKKLCGMSREFYKNFTKCTHGGKLLKLPSTNIEPTVELICKKFRWTKSHLAKELGVGPHTISRWIAGGGIHKVHYDELQRLAADEPTSDTSIEKLSPPLRVPFKVKIPRSSLKITLDENGDINIEGVILALLKEE